MKNYFRLMFDDDVGACGIKKKKLPSHENEKIGDDERKDSPAKKFIRHVYVWLFLLFLHLFFWRY